MALTVTCAPQADNLLRYDCVVEGPTKATVTVTWGPPDAPTERATTLAPATRHELVLWGLRPELDHVVRAASDDASGTTTITPAAVPARWSVEVGVTGAGATESVLLPLHCADVPTVGLIDRKGRLFWYQELEGEKIYAVAWTPDHTILALIDEETVMEVDLLGRQVSRLSALDGHFTGPVHHDVLRTEDGLTWLLGADVIEEGITTYVVDRVLGFRGTELVATWRVEDHLVRPLDPFADASPAFWAGQFPGALDYTHGNAISPGPDGELLLSFRKVHTVFAIRGNPGAANFGEVVWQLTGGPHSTEPSDFAITSSSGATDTFDFEGQHHPALDAQGRLLLFDNRAEFGPTSRALVFDLDVGTATADIVEAYDLGERCGVSGATYPLPGGHLLATCAPSQRAVEFAPGAADPVWTFEAACPDRINRIVPVVVPASLDAG